MVGAHLPRSNMEYDFGEARAFVPLRGLLRNIGGRGWGRGSTAILTLSAIGTFRERAVCLGMTIGLGLIRPRDSHLRRCAAWSEMGDLDSMSSVARTRSIT